MNWLIDVRSVTLRTVAGLCAEVEVFAIEVK